MGATVHSGKEGFGGGPVGRAPHAGSI